MSKFGFTQAVFLSKAALIFPTPDFQKPKMLDWILKPNSILRPLQWYAGKTWGVFTAKYPADGIKEVLHTILGDMQVPSRHRCSE